ncbi:glycerate kinase [Hominenteromicrobium sp.]|uniref:glycerate kinase family protein n=1 Tax=Hominenteromicrobium sp. TaxID=3073581 RepID=UPI003AF1746E
MRVVIAMDSFKGSLSSIEAGKAVAEGVRRADGTIECVVCPVADGGEGTSAALTEGLHGETVRVRVTGPLGEKVTAEYGVKGDLAILEMAQAAGLPLVPQDKRNPMKTTTYGVGEMLRDAINRGCKRFVLGIGGSATNDGGAGMLQALGFDLLDKDGNPVPFGAEGLRVLAKIENKNALPALKNCVIRAACDVTNPLCGENGCSAVFGPQKGAAPEMIREMDGYMRNYAALTKNLYPESDLDTSGAGAAGGLGFALGVFLHAELMPGIEIVMEETRLEEKIKNADFVVTGEGRLDAQTAMGKAPVGVAKLAKKYHKPVIAFAGGIEKGAEACNKAGITAFFPAVRGVTTLDEAMRPETAAENLAESAEQVFRLLTLR